jgi:hypothetical protein
MLESMKKLRMYLNATLDNTPQNRKIDSQKENRQKIKAAVNN